MTWSFFPSKPKFAMFPMTDAVRAAIERGGYTAASDPQLAAVVEALEDDAFIRAVKEFRIATGVGLRAAKEAVEAIAEDIST